MDYFSRNNTECGVFQSMRKNVYCGRFGGFKDNSLAMWQAGGNWGDLWGINMHRIRSFLPMLQKNITIFGMPQSLHYNNNDLKQKEADELKKIIEQTIGTVQSKHQIVLTWRQENSYNEALHLYPFVDNRLVPDIAFMIGPIKNTNYWTIPSTNEVDLLFLLRIDKESRIRSNRQNDAIQKIIDNIQSTKDNITFRIVDWHDRKEFYEPRVAATPMQQLYYKGMFDYNSRFASAVSLLSSGKVVITDRLHGSIFAFLSLKPHVFIDQMYDKIQRTRAVAFNSSKECQDEQALMYTQALDMKDAVEKAINMLERYRVT
jgi:pyruvyl transferase EpsO